MVAMMALLCDVIETTNVPGVLVQVAERAGRRDGAPETETPERGIDPEEVTLPVNPFTVMTGVHEAKSGTLKVRLTMIVLLSHGYGDDCVIPHFHEPSLD